MASTNVKLLKPCEICEKEESIYKCPKCLALSCSLSCTKKHKEQEGCSGIRDRTAMLQKYEMNDLTLLNDYRFLEEIEHKLDDGYRHSLRPFIHVNKFKTELPHHLKKLQSEAKARGTDLEFQPQHFTRHHHNTTRFIYSEGKIRWHIKWIFPQAGSVFYDEKVDEEKRIAQLLRRFIVPSKTDVLETNEQMRYYEAANFNGISVLMKTEMCKTASMFKEILLSKTLKLNLANKKVVEYPIFYVILKHHLDFYLNYRSDGDDHVLMEHLKEQESCSKHEDNVRKSSFKASKHPKVEKKDHGLSLFFGNSSSDEEKDDIEIAKRNFIKRLSTS